MSKSKKTKLTPEFWRRDALQRAEAERILDLARRRGLLKSPPPPPR